MTFQAKCTFSLKEKLEGNSEKYEKPIQVHLTNDHWNYNKKFNTTFVSYTRLLPIFLLQVIIITPHSYILSFDCHTKATHAFHINEHCMYWTWVTNELNELYKDLIHEYT